MGSFFRATATRSSVFFNTYINGFFLQSNSNKIFCFLRGGSTEKHSLPLLGQKSNDFLHFLFKPYIKDPICLINDQTLKIFVKEIFCILKMIQKSSRCRNQNVDSLRKLLSFTIPVCTSHNKTISVIMML